MDLELVEEAGHDGELRDSGALDKHVPEVRGPLGLGQRDRDVIHVGDVRPVADIDAGLTPAEDPDRHAVVMVAVPPARRLKGARPATTAPVAIISSSTWPLSPAGRPGIPDHYDGQPLARAPAAGQRDLTRRLPWRTHEGDRLRPAGAITWRSTGNVTTPLRRLTGRRPST
jgi:hypothetical protein